MKTTISITVNALLLLAAVLLTACGGGGNNSSSGASLTGQFVDSPVGGLRYTTTSTSGFTAADGTFSYKAGETVQFFVGDILIGSATGKSIVTPVDLVTGAVDETNPQVTNIVRFLQTIDADGNPANGIDITTVANNAGNGQNMDFTLAQGVFDTDGNIQTLVASMTTANGAGRPLISIADAQNNFRLALLELLAGNYQGTFAGDDTGTWTATINSAGTLTGTVTSNTIGSVNATGSISSSGQATMSGTVGTTVFSGAFSNTGSVSGTWSDGVDSGTFTGSKI
ncbi:hypothetical protein MNBD_GAMMA14-392 [hydrothermal vent metagenome]|uniref:Uncharacterized protein n=1 Tax=hydrothermal vent metagenome TaxID=652676 RepID=A0A3B0Z0E7_9ZZZZ